MAVVAERPGRWARCAHACLACQCAPTTVRVRVCVCVCLHEGGSAGAVAHVREWQQWGGCAARQAKATMPSQTKTVTTSRADIGQNVPSTIFKAAQKSSSVMQLLNHLFNARAGLSGY